MPDFSQSARGLEPATVVDHVLLPEAARSRLGRRGARALKEGGIFVGWALRTQDLDAVRAKLQGAGWDVPALVAGSRKRPDGQVLRWRTQDVEGDSDPTALPFVIEWLIPDGLHPGEAAGVHRGGATALRRVVVGARQPGLVRDQLELLLGQSRLYDVRQSDADGVEELALENEDGALVIT